MKTKSILLTSISAFLSMDPAHAATYNWIGGTNSNFTDPTNWVENAWTQWDDYHFGSAVTNPAVTINGFFGINSLVLQSGLTQDIVITSTTAQPVIMGVGVNGNSSALISIAADSKNLTINGDYIVAGNNGTTAVTWDVGTGRTLTLNGPLNNWITPPASLVKDGAGAAVLTSASGYTGSTTVNGGKLELQSTFASSGFAVGSGAVLELNVASGTRDYATTTFSGAGTLRKTGAGEAIWQNSIVTLALGAGSLIDVQGGTLSIGSFANDIMTANLSDLSVAGGATFNSAANDAYVNALTGSGTIILAYDNNYARTMTLGVNNGGGTFSGTITDGTNGGNGMLVKTGSGTQTLSGNNTYTGSTTVSGGTLVLQGTYASSGFSIASGTVLELNTASNLDFASTTFSGAGTLRKTGSAGAIWDSGAATFALSSGALIDVQGGNFVGGSNANENWTANLSDLNVASGAGFHGVEANVRVDALTGAGTISSGFSGAGYQNFTFGVDNGSGTFSGVLADSLAAGNFVKSGSGTQTLTGANSYTGGTTVNGGRLVFVNTQTGSANFTTNAELEFNVTTGVRHLAGGTINGTGNLIKTGGDQMWLGGNGSPQTVALTGASSIIDVQGGVLRNEYGNSAWGGNQAGLNVASGAFFDLWDGNATVDELTGSGTINKGWDQNNTLTIGVNNGSGTFSGVIYNNHTGLGYGGSSGGSLSLVKNGSGTQTLTGANTYTGSTTVSAGTLALQNTYASSGFAIASGAVLELNVASGTRDYATTTFSGAGTLRKTGGGEALWGESEATFAMGAGSLIDVQGGTLSIGSYADDIMTTNLSDLNVAAGATFNSAAADAYVNALTGSGTIILAYNNSYARTMTLGVNNGSGTFSGMITDGPNGGNGILVKSGSGTQTLTGANTYTGTTTVGSGFLVAASTAALGTTAAGTTVTSGATLEVRAVLDPEAISVGGDGVGGNGALVTSATFTGTVGGAVTLTAHTSVGGAGTLHINGVVTSSPGPLKNLTKVGAGTTHFGANPGSLAGVGDLTTTAGTTNVNSVLGIGSSNVSVTGASTLKFGSVSQTLGSLTIGAGSTVTFTSGLASFSGGGKSAGFGGSAVVPEPGTIGLLLVGALGVLGRRRRQA